MLFYKTIVTDYEGMQIALDSHASQGWRLFSVTPDTWRRTHQFGDGSDADSPPFNELSTGKPHTEYSAIYYLVIFERDEYVPSDELQAIAEETLPFENEFGGSSERSRKMDYEDR